MSIRNQNEEPESSGLVVLKFGGSSMGKKENHGQNFENLIDLIKRFKSAYGNVIVVCSAFQGHTKELVKQADDHGLKDQKRDALLAQGEIHSSGVLNDYLNDMNVSSTVMNGTKMPIKTKGTYGSASISEVDTKSITKRLKQKKVVIIPGFIGWNNQGKLMTLGFNGSDTTAVTVAAEMNADKVCLFKDVDGIYSVDPNKIKRSKKISRIAHSDMHKLSLCGADIIHPEAVKTAMDKNIDIHIVPTLNNGYGSVITNKCPQMPVAGIAYTQDVLDKGIILSVVGKEIRTQQSLWLLGLQQEGIFFNFAQEQINETLRIKVEKENLLRAVELAHRIYFENMNEKASPARQAESGRWQLMFPTKEISQAT